jgi:hypothetical protein
MVPSAAARNLWPNSKRRFAKSGKGSMQLLFGASAAVRDAGRLEASSAVKRLGPKLPRKLSDLKASDYFGLFRRIFGCLRMMGFSQWPLNYLPVASSLALRAELHCESFCWPALLDSLSMGDVLLLRMPPCGVFRGGRYRPRREVCTGLPPLVSQDD